MSEIPEKDKLQEFVDKIYKNKNNVQMKPLFPYILVRVLPRHRTHGLIYLPVDNNKVLLEGIVLDTFRSFWKQLRYVKRGCKWDSAVGNKYPGIEEDEYWLENVFVKSDVIPGDIILFQQYEGVPVEHVIFSTPYYKSKDYLLVSADPVGSGRNGIIAKLEGCEDIENALAEVAQGWGVQYSDLDEFVEEIKNKFVISLVDQTSKTQSGSTRRD